jgi:hypothetical protein
MRKGIVLLVITCIFSIVLSSDLSASDLRWQAGVKGGANWAKLVGDPVSLWLGDSQDGQLAGSIGDYKLGFTGGGFLTVFFNEFFGLQTELMYVPKGGQGTATGQIIFQPDYDNPRPAFFNGEVYAYLDYVEVPLLAVFEFEASEGGKIRLRGYAGTTFAFNVNAEARLKGTAEITMQDESTRYQEIDEKQEIGNYVKDFEFGLMFGGAVYWDIGKVDLLIESRWSRGLTTLDNTTLYRNINTSNVSLLFGFSYPFGG